MKTPRSTDFFVLRPNEKMVNSYFNWVFHTEAFADEFYKWGKGIDADVWTTHWMMMKKIVTPFPPLAEQREIAAFVCGAVAAFASPKNIEVVSRGDDGSFMLRLPASEIDLQLYYATSGGNDPWVVDASHWRNPHFIQDVTAGTTDLMVTLPPVHAADVVCFFLADPARATVRRVSYLIGGKDGNGKFNSAFLTGLHPDWDWRYEIAFAVPGFQLGQGWLLCHRDGAWR